MISGMRSWRIQRNILPHNVWSIIYQEYVNSFMEKMKEDSIIMDQEIEHCNYFDQYVHGVLPPRTKIFYYIVSIVGGRKNSRIQRWITDLWSQYWGKVNESNQQDVPFVEFGIF